VPDDVHEVAIDLLMLVGTAFERVGQADIAGRMASSYLSRSTLLKQPAATWDLSGAMARARQIRDALDLADEIDEADPDAGEASLAFTLPVLFHAGSLSRQECKRTVEVLQRRIERRSERGDAAGEAQACVNLANFYRTRTEPSRALDLYERALACDAGYADRAYYWEEKAGVLFGVKRYDEAAAGYQRALDLGSDEHVRALRADALLFSGEYAQARAEWQRLFESEPSGRRHAEYVLKLDFINEIIGRFGLDRQDRRPPSDLNVRLIQGPDRPSSDEARAAATAALGVDALDPRAWDLLGWAELNDGNLAAYARAMIPVACLLEREVDPWTKAVIFSLGVADGRLAAELLVTGQRLTGGVLLAALASHARENIPAGEREEWLEGLTASFSSIPPDDVGGFAVRFLGDDGTITVIEMPTAESSQRDGGPDWVGRGRMPFSWRRRSAQFINGSGFRPRLIACETVRKEPKEA
jgi:tetratricopeptide (TPR) repeat protein